MTGVRDRFHSALYRGSVMHARHDALARRAFTYSVYVASLDLDELPALDRDLWLFSHRKTNLMSFDEHDYSATLGPSHRLHGDLLGSLAEVRAANGLAAPHATRLVTNLRVASYTFNPVSFFLDYDAHGGVIGAIAEVNNTYGGRHRYVLGPSHRLPGPRVGFRHVRELFVSPFLHGERVYDFWFDAPLDGQHLGVEMHVTRPSGQRVFTAQLSGRRAPMSDWTLAAAALRYPLMSAQVIGLIHWQALKLRRIGVPYRQPATDQRPLSAPDELP